MVKWIALAALALLIVGVVAFPRIGRESAVSAQPAGAAAAAGQVRTYFIAADEVVWDYAPSGRNHTAPSGHIGENAAGAALRYPSRAGQGRQVAKPLRQRIRNGRLLRS